MHGSKFSREVTLTEEICKMFQIHSMGGTLHLLRNLHHLTGFGKFRRDDELHLGTLYLLCLAYLPRSNAILAGVTSFTLIVMY